MRGVGILLPNPLSVGGEKLEPWGGILTTIYTNCSRADQGGGGIHHTLDSRNKLTSQLIQNMSVDILTAQMFLRFKIQKYLKCRLSHGYKLVLIYCSGF